jgi:MerR family mercuric resistance operon transcriptional regulator
MRTKQVADRAGVNAETLRYYERRGLLPEPPRTRAGYRDYPESAVKVLRFVKRAQLLGFSLAEVESLLGLAEGGPESCDAARVLAQEHVADIDRRIAELCRMRGALEVLVDSCGRPRDRRACPLLETIQDDERPLLDGLGA